MYSLGYNIATNLNKNEVSIDARFNASQRLMLNDCGGLSNHISVSSGIKL